MVAKMLMLLVLAAAPVAAAAAEGGSGARAEARATATIVNRTVTLRNGRAETPIAELPPVRQRPRDCAASDKTTSDCRLIVYDLP